MDIHLHQAFLPHLDSDASLAFYRDAFGLEVREDVESGRRGASPSAPSTNHASR